MDPFTIAGGAAQFIGLLDLIIQMGKGLYTIFQECKHAKKVIDRITKALIATQRTLQSIKALKGTDDLDESFQNIISIIELAADDLNTLICLTDRYKIVDGGSKPSRMVRKVLFQVTTTPIITERLEKLEKTKSELSLALQSYSAHQIQKLHESNEKDAQRLEISLRSIELQMKKSTTISSQILTAAKRVERKLQRVETNLNQGRDIIQQMPEKINAVVRVAIREELRSSHERGYETKASPKQYSSLEGAFTPQSLSLQKSGLGRYCLEDSDPDEDTDTKVIARRRVSSATYTFPVMGVIQSTKSIIWDEEVDTESIQLDGRTRRITSKNRFTPSRWLWCRRAVTMYEKCGQSTMFQIHTLPALRVLPETSVVFYACENLDLPKVKELFQKGMASPFDVDIKGKGLLDHAFEHRIREGTMELVEFLLSQGVDPAPSFKSWVKWYHFVEDEMSFIRELGGYWGNDHENCLIVAEVGRKCFLRPGNCDTFEDVDNLYEVWQLSGITYGEVPLDADYFERDDMIGLHELVFKYPDQIFSDLTKVLPDIPFHDQLVVMHDFRFQTMKYLCRKGIKNRIFTKGSKDIYPNIEYSCFCQNSPTHLLFKQLISSGHTKDKLRMRLLRRHTYRMLDLLLASGEDPDVRCSCKAGWNRDGIGSRSLVCLAAKEGMLHVLAQAMEKNHYDGIGMVDEWLFAGLRSLFKLPDEDSSQDEDYDCGCYCMQCSNRSADALLPAKGGSEECLKEDLLQPTRSYSYSQLAKKVVTSAASVVLYAV